MAATSLGAFCQSNLAMRRARVLSSGSPPTSVGHAKKVRLHDPLKTGLASKVAAKEQVRRVVFRQPLDVTAEGGLDDHADDGAQVGVSHEQVVQLMA